MNRKSFLKSILAVAFAAPQIAFSTADFDKLNSGGVSKIIEIQIKIIKIENQFYIAELEDSKAFRLNYEQKI